jgi:hypothetical protein
MVWDADCKLFYQLPIKSKLLTFYAIMLRRLLTLIVNARGEANTGTILVLTSICALSSER